MARRKRQDFQVPTGRLVAAGGKRIHCAWQGERATSQVRSQVEWPLAAFPIRPGVAGGRLVTTKLRADLGC